MKTFLSTLGAAAVATFAWAPLAHAQTATTTSTTTTPAPTTTTTTAPVTAGTTTTPAATTTTATTPVTNSTTSTTVVQQPAPVAQTTTTSATTDPALATTADVPVTEHRFLNRPLLVTGLVLLGGTYAASAIVASTNDRTEDDKLYYPVVGPWMDLANRDCNARPCNNEGLNKGLLIADGIVQGVGALDVVLSLVVPETTTKNWLLIGNDTVHVAPARVGYAAYGLAAGGKF